MTNNDLTPFPLFAEKKIEYSPQHFQSKTKVAVVGRPNVGKSTLVNRLLGEERVIVFDEGGTTRDSIYIPFERDGCEYVLIDTAGVRRRGKTLEQLKSFRYLRPLKLQ